MSRYTSPGSTHSRSVQQIIVPSQRQRAKQHVTGIAAGAEDVKYQSKYKELRRKVKEIEADNDKLQVKVLQAKKNIQRMKLERAVLYERLMATPPSPDLHDRNRLPPMQSGPGIPPDQDYAYPAPNSRQSRDQTYDSEDRPYIPDLPGIAPPTHALRNNTSTSSRSGRDSSRQLPPLPQVLSGQHYEAPYPVGRHLSPQVSSHTHPSSPLEHGRSSNRFRQYQEQISIPGLPHPLQYPQEYLPQSQLLHPNTALSSERGSRGHHVHELASSHSESPSHSRRTIAPPPRSRSSDARGSNRSHSHQLNGIGVYVSRNDDRLDREQDWEQSHELASARERSIQRVNSPMSHPSMRHEHDRLGDYLENHSNSRVREEVYHEEGSRQRSVTPASGSSAQGESRPDSRSRFYNSQDRYASRPENRPNEELGLVREDGRSESGNREGGVHQQEHSRESRKRSRNDMEALGGEHDVTIGGKKRFHQGNNSDSG